MVIFKEKITMDFDKLNRSTHWLDYFSFNFNTEKCVILNNSLLILQSENHFKKVYFWGIIHCLDLDYFIAFGYQKDAIADRKFFYSEDGQNWKLLPEPQPNHLVLTELCRRPFQGDASLIIDVVDDAPFEELSIDEVKSEKDSSYDDRKFSVDHGVLPETTEKIQNGNEQVFPASAGKIEEGKKSLGGEGIQRTVSQTTNEAPIQSGEIKEEDRLAATVHIISEETSIAPRGGLFKQTDGTVVHSRAFEGLKVDEADELCSFLHYRTPQQDCNTNLLTRVDYNYAMDFLDTIDKDLPEDIWRAQLVEGERAILLRNLTWPGFMFFHHLETPDYGFIYVGNGQRNLDVPFMTQINELIVPKEPSKSSVADSKTSKSLSKTNSKPIEEAVSDAENEILLPVPKETRPTLSNDIITSA